jgi:hypothetical protein
VRVGLALGLLAGDPRVIASWIRFQVLLQTLLAHG